MYGDQPVLVVLDGSSRGWWTPILPGRRVEIGRAPGNGLVVNDASVSRQHARVVHDGNRVILFDLGSANGTWINDRSVRGSAGLSDGDVIRMGQVALRYSASGGRSSYPATPGSWNDFGGIHRVNGPVNVGSGYQNYQGVHWQGDAHIDAGPSDPLREAVAGAGLGRFLIVVGGLICLTGFGGWMSVIFSGFGNIGDPSIEDPTNPSFDDPFSKELVPGVPLAVASFAAFLIGGLIVAIGTAMSRAARHRRDQAGRYRRPGY